MKYTLDERMELYKEGRAISSGPLRLALLTWDEEYLKNRYKELYEYLNKPLVKLMQDINNPDPLVQEIIKWRLRIGK